MNGWYDYPSGWLNIWFYDHPFDYERKKMIHIEFDAFQMDPSQPAMLEFAVNWSTNQWLTEESPPTPPLEEPFLERHTLFAGEFFEGHYTYDFEIEDYNPIWVSIDVRGFNFMIPGGLIAHDCVQSLDLSFVINGPEPGEPDIDVIPPDLNYEQCINTVQDYTGAFQICNIGTANLTINSITCTLPFASIWNWRCWRVNWRCEICPRLGTIAIKGIWGSSPLITL